MPKKTTVSDVKITKDKKFEELIRELTDEESNTLEASIAAEGCRDALVVWGHRGKNILLDGHHRLAICKRLGKTFKVMVKEFEDEVYAIAWVVDNQLGRRNLETSDRIELIQEKRPYLKKEADKRQEDGRDKGRESQNVSNSESDGVDGGGSGPNGPQPDTELEDGRVEDQMADAAQTSRTTLRKWQYVMSGGNDAAMKNARACKIKWKDIDVPKAIDDIRQKMLDKSFAIDKANSEVKKYYKKKVKATERAAAVKRAKEEAAKADQDARGKRINASVIHDDKGFVEVAKKIKDESVDLIFADPPYDRKSLPMYGDMAKVASRVLKPGGSLVCYGGQYITHEILDLVTPHLRAWWILACVHTGPCARMNEYGIVVGWKPMLWFVKGTRGDKETFVDDTIQSVREKDSHAWQQSLVEAEYYIEKLSPEDGMVFDPFCGGGTTALAAEKLGRRWITCDTDAEAVELAKKRIREYEPGK